MKYINTAFAACLFAFVSITSCKKDDDDDKPKLNTTDTNFMIGASISNNSEISAATIASTKATNAAVKVFAQSMRTEHTQHRRS